MHVRDTEASAGGRPESTTVIGWRLERQCGEGRDVHTRLEDNGERLARKGKDSTGPLDIDGQTSTT